MLKKLQFKPGVVKSNSEYAEPGRYIDTQWVRFVGGYPQKMGGFATFMTPTLSGVCRGILCWRDNKSADRVAFGTEKKLYVAANGALTDITPLQGLETGTLTSPVTTTNGSATVTIADVAHGQAIGDYVTLTATSEVGGVLIAGNYIIQTVPGANSYTITAPLLATSGATGGGSTSYTYYRKLLTADPFATTSGSPLVTVTDAVSVTEGDTVIFAGASAVAGLTISGSYTVTSAPGTGIYVITASGNASATTTGGGATVTIQHELGSGLSNTLAGYGWGAGTYGSSTWGTPRTTSGIILHLRTWAMWAYGQILLANPRGGAIYEWDPDVGGRAVAIYNGPSLCLSFFVTEERYIVALGKDGDYLKLGWPDQEDRTDWVASVTDTANPSRKVQGGNYFQAGAPVRNQISLIWTDTATFLHQWRSDQYVFTTTKISDKTGLLGPKAYAVLGEVAYWVGDGEFWKWDGAVNPLPSNDIGDWFFRDLDRSQRHKIYGATIASQNEIIFLYQSVGSSEVNRYLLYNVVDQVWACGSTGTTSWHDRGLFEWPIGTSTNTVYYYEREYDGSQETDGSNPAAILSYVVAAPVDIDDGEQNLDVFGFWPDIEDQAGDLELTVLLRDNAQDIPTEDGPFTLGIDHEPEDLRSSGKMAGFKILSNQVGGYFRLGVQRVDVQPSGHRR